MSDQQNERSAHYNRAREAFDDLKIEDKALFLIDAMVSTITRGLEDAGRTLTHEVDALFRKMSASDGAEEKKEEAPAPAPEPPAAKAAAPKKAAPKKRATTRKRATPRKTTKPKADDEGAS